MQDDRKQSHRSAPTGLNRRFAVITVAGLLLAMWLPLVATSFLPRPSLSFTEKRFLAKWPTLEATRASIASWPDGVEAWFDDNLGSRDWLIRSWARLHIGLFGLSPAELVVVGKDGWLFLGDPDALAHYRGLDPLTERELDTWRRVVTQRRDWLAERGIAYLLVLVPDKHLIYSEYMPDSLPRTTDIDPLGQLSHHLRSTTDVEVLDLRPPLIDAKGQDRIYHKTDSHWNDVGAYTAYRAIHAQLQVMLAALADVPPVRIERGHHVEAGLGLASTVGLAERYPEEVLEARIIEPRATTKPEPVTAPSKPADVLRKIEYDQPDRSLPRAVMFRDSFGNALIPYVAEDFSHIVYVWGRDIDPDLVIRERPDVVIQEIVGRFLGRRPKGIEEVRARKGRTRAP